MSCTENCVQSLTCFSRPLLLYFLICLMPLISFCWWAWRFFRLRIEMTFWLRFYGKEEMMNDPFPLNTSFTISIHNSSQLLLTWCHVFQLRITNKLIVKKNFKNSFLSPKPPLSMFELSLSVTSFVVIFCMISSLWCHHFSNFFITFFAVVQKRKRSDIWVH